MRYSRSSATSASVRPGARPPCVDQLGERGVGDRARGAQRGELGVVLDHAQLLDQPGRADQGDRRCASSASAAWASTVTWSDSNPSAPIPSSAANPARVSGARPLDHGLQVGHLGGDLRAVAAVGAQAALRVAVDVHEQRGVRPGEAGEVADVDQVGDQQRVDARGRAARAARPAGRQSSRAHGHVGGLQQLDVGAFQPARAWPGRRARRSAARPPRAFLSPRMDSTSSGSTPGA